MVRPSVLAQSAAAAFGRDCQENTGIKVMEDAKTRWEQLQGRFKNSWIGIIILALIALTAVLAQVGDLAKKVSEWIRPAPAANLRPIAPSIKPLDQFSDKAVRVGLDTIYPVGATFDFNLVHDGPGDEVIIIDGVDVRVDAFEPGVDCPFTLTGDRIFGRGEAPVRVFTVYMADGRVSSVQYKPAPNEGMRRGHSNNLLATEGPEGTATRLRLRKAGDETEAMTVKFIVDDAAQYRIGLSIRYENRNGAKVASFPSVTVCKPREVAP
jgi:hypothetical protein